MTDRLTARLVNKDKRKAKKHGWTEENPLELPINPVEEKIEETNTLFGVLKDYFTKGE